MSFVLIKNYSLFYILDDPVGRNRDDEDEVFSLFFKSMNKQMKK